MDFTALVGQQHLVQTISNAIKHNRLAHAFLLTGIRGVGKTTTARIIAKTINCENLDLSKDTIVACNQCSNCKAFATESHPDVVELDAASRTGVNDVRELIESCQYLPLKGKYKVYIIDEVHMLSNSAFNALLKTLEEPPAHVKFIFATTEIRKIPVTIISRCQRFDLRRVKKNELVEYLVNVLRKENVAAEQGALEIIAEYSEGSVRDSLSLLDRAISSSIGEANQSVLVTEEIVRGILGLVSRINYFKLFALVVDSNTTEGLKQVKELYESGADPLNIAEELLDICHYISKIKVASSLLHNSSLPEEEINLAKSISEKTAVSGLTTLWQILIKNIQELRYAPNPIAALEMLIIKLCFAAQLPPISEIISNIEKGESNFSRPASSNQDVKHNNIFQQATSEHSRAPKQKTDTELQSQIQLAPRKTNDITPEAPQATIGSKINNFKEFVQLFKDKQELVLWHYLNDDVNLIEFNNLKIIIKVAPHVPTIFTGQLKKLLYDWTGEMWSVVISNEAGQQSLKEQEHAKQQQMKLEVTRDEMVKSVLDAFPGAKVSEVMNN